MHININIRSSIARQCESDFVVPIVVDVVAPGKFSIDNAHNDLESEYVVGRLWSERIDWFRAEVQGYSHVDLCDSTSATWLQVYETLMSRKGNGFRKDLNLDGLIADLVFVHEFLLHPDITDRLTVLDAILKGISSEQGLVLMNHEAIEDGQLEDWELRDLGFKKIARSNLVLRNNQLRYPFGDAHIGGRPYEFSATSEHEEWLMERWDHLIADYRE